MRGGEKLGIFDYVDFEMVCPRCGNKITEFHTKDGDPYMNKVGFHTLLYFYGSCEKCGLLVKVNRKPATGIDDFHVRIDDDVLPG